MDYRQRLINRLRNLDQALADFIDRANAEREVTQRLLDLMDTDPRDEQSIVIHLRGCGWSENTGMVYIVDTVTYDETTIAWIDPRVADMPSVGSNVNQADLVACWTNETAESFEG